MNSIVGNQIYIKEKNANDKIKNTKTKEITKNKNNPPKSRKLSISICFKRSYNRSKENTYSSRRQNYVYTT